MKISVVIPCLNAAATLPAQLDALLAQAGQGDCEVIVADNGSSDPSCEIANAYRGRLPNLHVIDASARLGAAHARNCGARRARGEAIAFCDADDVVGTGWVEAIDEALARHYFVASRLDFARLNPGWAATGVRHAQERGLQRVGYPPYLHHAGGSGLGVRRKVHEEIGGFDESLPYLEDTDYCFRIQRAGYELAFAPAALVHVRLPERPSRLFNQARHWARYNALMNRRYGAGASVPNPWRVHAQRWYDLLRCAERLFRRDARPAWLKAMGTQVGLLEGALRYRVPPVR